MRGGGCEKREGEGWRGGRREGGRVVVVDVCGILRGSCGVVAMRDT